jgi:hypothetical protein
MNKLDAAITAIYRLSAMGGDSEQVAYATAQALEEIRDLLTVDKQSNTEEQSATFEPWSDVVEIVGPTSIVMASDPCFIGFEGVVTDTYGDGEYRVQIPDLEDWFYFPASSLRLVYRLKPRAQEPQPVFNAGDWIYDEETDRQEEISEVHDRTVVTKAGRILFKSLITKIDKPAPFQMGDWVRDLIDDQTYQIANIDQRYLHLTNGTRIEPRYVEKTNPPTLRFTFGQRVRCSYWKDKQCFIIGPAEIKDRMHVAIEGETYRTVHIETLTLDTAAD